MSLRIAVLGPGGIGGLLAAVLARAGETVEVVAREDTCRVLNAQGIRVESAVFGDFLVAVHAAPRLSRQVDVCLVAVKNTQLDSALQRVPAAALGEALVVPLLNGIEHVDILRRRYGAASVAAATIRVETARAEPGHLRQTSPFCLMQVAASRETRKRVESLATAFRGAGMDITVRDDETAMLWEKLSFLAPLALLTSHERAPAGIIRTRRRADTLAVIAEVAAVATSDGVLIDAAAVVRMMDGIPEGMESSMQRDQAAGQPLEIDAIGGVIVRRAARAGVSVPVTTRLVEELRQRSGS